MIPTKTLKLASLDGGGFRSMSQLLTMQNIMHRLRWDTYPEEKDKVMLPCDYFDLIGGSDTGGLIAIMLAKLRMSVDEVITEFCIILSKVYTHDLEPAERTSRLRECMEDLLTRKGYPTNLRLEDPKQVSDGGCIGFALAAHRDNVCAKVCLRTYQVLDDCPSSITVVNAALATCAEWPEFSAVSFQSGTVRHSYVGPGPGGSNPLLQIVKEAYSYFGGDCSISTLLSFGCGHPGIFSITPAGGEDDWRRLKQHMIIENEEKTQRIQNLMDGVGLYFRFSVEQGMQLGHIRGEDLSWICSQTSAYLSSSSQVTTLNKCVRSLIFTNETTTLRQLGRTLGLIPAFTRTPSERTLSPENSYRYRLFEADTLQSEVQDVHIESDDDSQATACEGDPITTSSWINGVMQWLQQLARGKPVQSKCTAKSLALLIGH